jgi:probable rRNA maturation factor
MDPSSRPSPAAAGLPSASPPSGRDVDIILAEPAWRRALRRPEAIAHRAALAAISHDGGVPATIVSATIVLADDAAVQRLNARHRARNKPTNVLTFEPAFPGLPGEIVLALGTVRREARAAGRRIGDHLAHLVIHGMLHLQGHDHALAGPARRMEMAESRALARLGRPNPWRHGSMRA